MEQPLETTDEPLSLADRVDRNSEGWQVLQLHKEILYRRFFRSGTTDFEYTFDTEDFNEYLERAITTIFTQFEASDSVSREEIKESLLSMLSNEWDKKVTQLHRNTDLGSQALTEAFRRAGLVEQELDTDRPRF